jgi:hypothetical protein
LLAVFLISRPCSDSLISAAYVSVGNLVGTAWSLCRAWTISTLAILWRCIIMFLVLVCWQPESMWSALSAHRADGAVCIGREAIPVGVFLIKNCTSAVPHNITIFIDFRFLLFQKASVACLLTKGLRSFQ